jgi:hypothetical protein
MAMPEWAAETLKYVGPFSAFLLLLVALLVYDRRNNRSKIGGNPGPPLVNGRWQEQMKASQDTANATLGRIEEGMKEAVRLLTLMEDRQQRE